MRSIVERINEALIDQFNISIFLISFLIFSLGESCSHVASILFNIMALNEAGLTSESCTSREPAWKVPSYSRKYDPVPLSSLQFTKPSFESLMNIPTKSRKRVKVDISDIPPISSQEMQSLLNVAPRSAAAIYIEKENVDSRKIYKLSELSGSALELQNLHPTISEIVEIANSTSEQARCTAWHDYRYGRVTSTSIDSVVRVIFDASKMSVEALCKKITGQSSLSSSHLPKQIKWGNSKENTAKKDLGAYMCATGHVDVKILDVGIIINKDIPIMASSPDCVISCACCGESVVEIKCPYNKDDTQLKDPNDLETLEGIPYLKENEGKPMLNMDHKHYQQLQCHIGVFRTLFSDSNFGYFVVWTTKGIFVQKVEFDQDCFEKQSNAAKAFYAKYLKAFIQKANLEGHED